MSTNQARALLEKAAEDQELRQTLEAQGSIEGIVSYASDSGYNFTPDEFQEAATDYFGQTGELGEEQLEAVAGGASVIITIWISK